VPGGGASVIARFNSPLAEIAKLVMCGCTCGEVICFANM
jgi:hypothetical protein